MKAIIKKRMYPCRALILLLGSVFLCNTSYADNVRCGPDSNITNSITAFDFNSLPSEIPDTVPIGTTIYDVTMNLDLWCAKDISAASGGARKIYINREALDNVLGSQSGLTFYVTINGERDSARRSYDSGYTTNALFLQGLATSFYTRLNVSVRVELVKTGQNVALSPLRNDIWLFSIGDAGTGYLRYRATNVKKLSFSAYTCNISTPSMHQRLPEVNIADLKSNGRVEGHEADFSVSLNCNGDLWSTLSINMAFNGSPVAGLERQGVYPFRKGNNEIAEGIGFQIRHRNGAGDYVESGNGEFFKIGDFTQQSKILTVPLKANYYRISDRLSPGELTGSVTYIVDYM